MLEPKFRPYLTKSEIEYLLTLLEKEEKTKANKNIHKVFRTLLIKAEVGIATGSYTPTPRTTLQSKLGFASEQESRYLNGEMTQEEEIEQQKSRQQQPT